MKRLIRDVLRAIALYLAVVVGGTVSFLCVAPVLGYQGRGEFGRARVTWRAFSESALLVLGWAVLLVPYAIVVALVLFISARLLEKLRTPYIAVAAASGLLAGLASGYVVLGIGWYINIDEFAVYFALILGVVYGVGVLPRGQRRGV
jgi:hypothetical protein